MDDKINKILKNNYPIKTSFNDINNMSHFFILFNDWNKFIPFQLNIEGKINNNYITKVITKNNTLKWKDYLLVYISFLNKNYNPCISENKFLCLLHTYSFIDELNIQKLILDNNVIIEISYTKNIKYNLIWNEKLSKKIDKPNHFYFESFNVNQNKKNLKTEIIRLFINRNNYKTIHFHLDNNGGGDLVPVHLILRCLCGKKEKWMKNIKKILTNKNIIEWNCWNEDDQHANNYQVVKNLDLDFIPNYNNKYTGKIYLYMNKQNGSAAWFFITYLIYAFANKIKRYHKKCFGQIIKFGNIESKQLVLRGHSGTTSGDGNSIEININKIKIICPTEQFLSCSIKNKDWNRFWF